jgi:hypothetical protein
MKEVVHIKDSVGPHGGRYWFLTLSCGHFKAVRQPHFRGVQAIVRPIRFAPKSVHCIVCDLGERSRTP